MPEHNRLSGPHFSQHDLNNRTVVEEAIAGIAHKINQPLYAIANYAKACERALQSQSSPDISNVLEMLQSISDAVFRSKNIIKKLRDYAHSTEGVRLPLSINTIVQQTCILLQAESEHLGIEFQLDLHASDLVCVDPVQIQHVLVSLIRNAFESSSNDSSEQVVRIATQEQESQILTTIQDYGCGIHGNDSEDIYQAFVSTKEFGMGMGLAVSRSIIAGHKGQIWHDSDVAKGAIFHFCLPKHEKTTS